MTKSKRHLFFTLAVAASVGIFAFDAMAATLITLCFRGRTIQVPDYLEPRYLSAGATEGPCPITP